MLTSNRHMRVLFAAFVLLLIVLAPSLLRAQDSSAPSAAQGGMSAPSGAVSLTGTGGAQSQVNVPPMRPTSNGMVVGYSYKNDVSPPLRDIVPIPVAMKPGEAERELEQIPLIGHVNRPDTVVQRDFGSLSSLAMPATFRNFDGLNQAESCGSCLPPDTNGEIGLRHYIQTTNSAFKIWGKFGGTSTTPPLLYGPAGINTIWTTFGGLCQNTNRGDPIVLYDQLADRWFISQFAFNVGGFPVHPIPPFDECIAISTTSDPLGSWNRYAFQLSAPSGPTASYFPDYPHFGMWPDGYYMSANIFDVNAPPCCQYKGPQPFVFERAKMLTGDPLAGVQTNSTGPLGSSVYPMLPSDLDGSIQPLAGEPNFYQGLSPTGLNLYKFHVTWPPGGTTFTGPVAIAGAAGWSPVSCTDSFGNVTLTCIPQPGTTVKLDSISDRLMFRLAYRRFSDGYESLVTNHSVNVGGGQAGIRWYEVRSPNSAPTVYQQGSYAPDTTNRWMGSAAMDKDGDLAVGYSASNSTSVYPSIRYAGRLVGGPLGLLTQGEATLIAGAGSQTSPYHRWGDYSDLTVDPASDCIFWYTTEYMQAGLTTSSWKTRIGSFKFPSCTNSNLMTGASNVTVCDTHPISFLAATPGPATPYPATINVSGLTGRPIVSVKVVLDNIYHASPDDLDVMLVGPQGQKVMLMSDAGGGFSLNNVTLRFADSGPALPDNAQIIGVSSIPGSGIYKPTNWAGGDADAFPPPAPGGLPSTPPTKY